MTGFSIITKIERLCERCEKLGFKWTSTSPRYRDNYMDTISLMPMDQDSLPVYSRDAEVFIGTIEELEIWLMGVEWARNYDEMIMGKKFITEKRARKEQDIRNKNLARKLTE